MGTAASIQKELALPTDGSDLSDKNASLKEVIKLRSTLTTLNNFILDDQNRQMELARRRSNGKVKIIYERYDDLFELKDGGISIAVVDEEYCLSDVMPGCSLELLSMTPKDRIAQEVSGIPTPFNNKANENSAWDELYTYDDEPKAYWVVAFQDPELLAADLAATKKRMDAMAGEDDGSGVCTCTNGKACSMKNKDHCKDFPNRFTVAAKYKAWLSSSIAPSASHDRYGGVVAE